MLEIITAIIVYGGVILAVLAAIGLGISVIMLLSYAIYQLIKLTFTPL